MLLDFIKQSWKTIIFIGIVSLVTYWAFNIKSIMITEETINGIKVYFINIRPYLQNISNSWERAALNFRDILPSREYTEVTGSFIEEDFWEAIVNNLALTFDWLYFPINFILWLDRWLCWLLRLLLAVVGWNVGINPETGNYYSELANILNWCLDNLIIPYI